MLDRTTANPQSQQFTFGQQLGNGTLNALLPATCADKRAIAGRKCNFTMWHLSLAMNSLSNQVISIHTRVQPRWLLHRACRAGPTRLVSFHEHACRD